MQNFRISIQRFNEFAQEYAQRYEDIGPYEDSINLFFNLVQGDQPAILELGCGPGNVTRLMSSRFPHSQIMALDLAPRMIEIARKHLPEVDFRIMDVRNILSISEKFDAIMCSFCLPFLSKEDAHRLISDCAAMLQPKGVIYIVTMEGDESKAGFEATSFSGQTEIYFNYHRKEDVEKAFTDAALEICFMKLQDYPEPDGRTTTDLIFVGRKAT